MNKYDTDLERNYCSCPAWKFQKGLRPEERTCKRLLAIQVQLLGGRVPGPGLPVVAAAARAKYITDYRRDAKHLKRRITLED